MAPPVHSHFKSMWPQSSSLTHEYQVLTDRRALDCVQKETAFNNAKARGLWRADTYSMTNSAEYFGEATGAYFLVNLQTGGMTE